MAYAEYPLSISPTVERIPNPACDRAFTFVPDRIRMYVYDSMNDKRFNITPFIPREQQYGITSYDIDMLRLLGIRL